MIRTQQIDARDIEPHDLAATKRQVDAFADFVPALIAVTVDDDVAHLEQNLKMAPNKILSQRWTEASREMHYKHLLEMRAITDSSLPIAYQYSLMKQKKEQILEDRCTEIERENRLLLEKIATIVRDRRPR